MLIEFILYLLISIFEAIFVIILPIDEEWYMNNVVYSDEIVSVNRYGENTELKLYIESYDNQFEVSKFYHNEGMHERKRYILYGLFLISLICSYITFYHKPKIKGQDPGYSGMFAVILFGILTVSLMPLIYSWILPPPVKWLPSILKEINEAQVNEALRKLMH